MPKLLVTGGWKPELNPGTESTGHAFRAVAQTLATAIRAQQVTFADSTHNPQVQEPGRFNQLLRATWRATADRPSP